MSAFARELTWGLVAVVALTGWCVAMALSVFGTPLPDWALVGAGVASGVSLQRWSECR